MQGQRNVMIGVRNNEVVYVPLSEAIRSDKPFDNPHQHFCSLPYFIHIERGVGKHSSRYSTSIAN